jgi:Ca2+-binding RTX toxin-like protein
MEGMSGYDWVTYKNDTLGVTVDLTLEAFDETPIPPSNAAVMDRFGSWRACPAPTSATSCSVTTPMRPRSRPPAIAAACLPSEGIARIDGLQDILGAGVTSFDGGNIILGGGGSDVIQGRGGNDIIDGDALLNVRISIRDGAGNEIGTPTAWSAW